MAWPVVMPPDVPAPRVKALRDAFDVSVKDPEFLADAAKQKLIINPVSGQALQDLLERVYATPKDILDLVTALSDRN